MNITATLREQRDELAERVAETETDAFPGSRAYKAYSAALGALAAFDEAHPEIIGAIETEHREELLDGKDIAGM